MTIKEINELLEKGFTPEFIMKIDAGEAQPAAAPNPQTPPSAAPNPKPAQPAAAPDPQPQPAAAPDPQPQAEQNPMQDFNAQVAEMTKAINSAILKLQQANINTVNQPGPVVETTDQILAQIINPKE